jgi:hypothetical protein
MIIQYIFDRHEYISACRHDRKKAALCMTVIYFLEGMLQFLCVLHVVALAKNASCAEHVCLPA